MNLVEIKQLPVNVANQIAAGEVVERPLSVIKELLENALDANASTIIVDIEKGGLALCRVRDDGDGIAKAQLPLAIAPHATSKITSVDDLMSLHSLGFRGEALASISSVSRFKIISKPQEQEDACALSIEDPRLPEITLAAHPKGTTIEVRDLFYNVPVRRTFLKSAKTEFLHIESIVKKIALSRFDLSMHLSHNGKTCFKLPAATSEAMIDRRLSILLGKPFMDSSHYFEEQKQDLMLKGWLGAPEYLRSQNDLQYIFLNGRMVKDKLLMHAVRRVYEPYLYPGRSACFLLYFKLPASEVDVNVHPTKHEVRFKEPRSIHDFFISVLSRVLEEEMTKELPASVSPSFPQEQEGEIGVRDPASSTANKKNAMPYYEVIPSSLSMDLVIMPLNKVHGLFLFEDKSYIFHVEDIYKKQLESRLEALIASDGHLVSRPVLVPLMIELSAKALTDFPFEKAKQYGFEMMPLSENSLAVRGFPIITPHLDIEACVKAMSLGKGSFEKRLSNSQCVSLSLLNASEQKSLIQFLIEQEQQGIKHLPYHCLSETDLQEIIYEK